jgi:Spy/CpxP family protein refolding chaperone
MKRLFLLSLAAVILTACLGIPAMANDTGSLITPAIIEEASKDANISGDQIGKIMAEWYKTQKEVVKLKFEIEIKAIDLTSAMESDKFDPKVITDLVSQMGDLRTKIELADTRFMFKVKEVLRPDQFKKVKDAAKKSQAAPAPSGAQVGP